MNAMSDEARRLLSESIEQQNELYKASAAAINDVSLKCRQMFVDIYRVQMDELRLARGKPLNKEAPDAGPTEVHDTNEPIV